MTLGITEVNTNGFHEFYALFSPRNKFKTSILTSQLKQMSCSKNDEEKKDARSSLRQCIPATNSAFLQKVVSKWDKPCDFFRSPLRAN